MQDSNLQMVGLPSTYSTPILSALALTLSHFVPYLYRICFNTCPLVLYSPLRGGRHVCEGSCRPVEWGIATAVSRLFNNNIVCIYLQYRFLNVHNLLTFRYMQVLAWRICHMPCLCRRVQLCRSQDVLLCHRFRCRL